MQGIKKEGKIAEGAVSAEEAGMCTLSRGDRTERAGINKFSREDHAEKSDLRMPGRNDHAEKADIRTPGQEDCVPKPDKCMPGWGDRAEKTDMRTLSRGDRAEEAVINKSSREDHAEKSDLRMPGGDNRAEKLDTHISGRNDSAGKPDICTLSPDDLKELIAGLGQPAYRAGQIYTWLHKRKAVSFDEMTDLPASLRTRLKEHFRITAMEPAEVLISRIDGTRKYVLRLFDGNVIEAVLMKYKHGNTVCVSSQVGCRMGCRFCASTLDGCVRNLTGAEMLAEVYRIERDLGERVSNIVIMGSGEPLDNYEQVIRFIRMVSDKNGLNISIRNITLSTCGIVPGIIRLAEEGLAVNLSLSLHAPTDDKRRELMPIANRYSIAEVLEACRYFYNKTGRRLTFEYSVVKDVNDNAREAAALARLLRSLGLKSASGGREGAFLVNLIPVNPIKERDYESPDRAALMRFRGILAGAGINVTVRREMGRDISSACGQLKRRYIENVSQGVN